MDPIVKTRFTMKEELVLRLRSSSAAQQSQMGALFLIELCKRRTQKGFVPLILAASVSSSARSAAAVAVDEQITLLTLVPTEEMSPDEAGDHRSLLAKLRFVKAAVLPRIGAVFREDLPAPGSAIDVFDQLEGDIGQWVDGFGEIRRDAYQSFFDPRSPEGESLHSHSPESIRA